MYRCLFSQKNILHFIESNSRKLPPPTHRKKLYTMKRSPVLSTGAFGSYSQIILNGEKSKFGVKDFSHRETHENIEREIFIHKHVSEKNVRHIVKYHMSRTPSEKHSGGFIIMDHKEIGDMFYLYEKIGFMSENECKYYAKRLVETVHDMHEIDIYHMDIKLENIFIDSKFRSFLGDFGLSIHGKTCFRRSGSIDYCAPELKFSNNISLDKCDVWSIGCVIFILMYGYAPFYHQSFLDCVWQNNMELFWEKHQKNTCYTPSDDLKDLLNKIFVYDHSKRENLKNILIHPWLSSSTDEKKILTSIEERFL